jgi:hypothetical protein
MTSSDLTLLPPDAKDRVAARVGSSLDGRGRPHPAVRVGMACAEFNGGITDRLLTGALDALEELGGDLAEVRRGLGARGIRAAGGGPAAGRRPTRWTR